MKEHPHFGHIYMRTKEEALCDISIGDWVRIKDMSGHAFLSHEAFHYPGKVFEVREIEIDHSGFIYIRGSFFNKGLYANEVEKIISIKELVTEKLKGNVRA